MGNTTNIVVGIQNDSTLKIAAYATAESTAVDAGYIKGGVAISHDETRYEVKVDQALGAVDMVPTAEKMSIKLSLAEATLANLALAYGYAAASGGSFSFGSKDSAQYRTLYINVKGPGGALRKYTFWKCSPNGKTSQAYKRDNETVVDIEFDVLCDTTKDQYCRFGMVTDSGADTTPPLFALATPSVAANSLASVVVAITEAGAMDEASLKYGVSIMVRSGSSLVNGALSYNSAAKTLAFTPAAAWTAGSYQFVATTGVKDACGNRLAAPFICTVTAA